jgi:hypothetical protein
VLAVCAFGLIRHHGRLLREEAARSRNELGVRNLQLERLTAALSGQARSNMVALNMNSRLLLENAKMAPRLWLNMQCALFPVEIGVLGVLHLGVTHTRIQEQTIEQFFFFIHDRKHRLEFLLRGRASAASRRNEFRQDLAGGENVPCAQESVQGFEDVVNRAIVKIAFMLSQELHVAQKLLAVDLVEVSKVLLRREVEEEAESIVVRPQRLLTLALLISRARRNKVRQGQIHSDPSEAPLEDQGQNARTECPAPRSRVSKWKREP